MRSGLQMGSRPLSILQAESGPNLKTACKSLMPCLKTLHALNGTEGYLGAPQEGDGTYADSEPPAADATIARFVVIGGALSATTPCIEY